MSKKIISAIAGSAILLLCTFFVLADENSGLYEVDPQIASKLYGGGDCKTYSWNHCQEVLEGCEAVSCNVLNFADGNYKKDPDEDPIYCGVKACGTRYEIKLCNTAG